MKRKIQGTDFETPAKKTYRLIWVAFHSVFLLVAFIFGAILKAYNDWSLLDCLATGTFFSGLLDVMFMALFYHLFLNEDTVLSRLKDYYAGLMMTNILAQEDEEQKQRTLLQEVRDQVWQKFGTGAVFPVKTITSK